MIWIFGGPYLNRMQGARCADIMGENLFRQLKVKDLRVSAGLIEHRMTIILPPPG